MIYHPDLGIWTPPRRDPQKRVILPDEVRCPGRDPFVRVDEWPRPQQAMPYIDSYRFAASGITVPTPPIAGYTLYTFCEAGTFQMITGTTPAVADNDVVGYWTDQSGSNNHLLAAANNTTRPTLQTNQANGYAAVRFDGSNDRLEAIFSQNKPYTVFVVFKTIGYVTTPSATGIWSKGTASPYLYPYATNGLGLVQPAREMDTGVSTLTAQYNVVGCVCADNDNYISYRSSASTNTNSDIGLTANLTALTVGFGSGAQGYTNSDFLSVLFYPSRVSNADVNTIRDWYGHDVFAFW